MQNYPKKGYLSSDFRVFHLHDEKLRTIPFHYHDFHKIILFLGGDVDYIIEGNSYHLQPDDIVFVAAGEIHRPVFGGDGEKTPYERIVIYIAPDFLQRLDERAKLAKCFAAAREKGRVMHQLPNRSHDLLFHMDKLEKTAHGEGFANGLYTEILFIEFLILLNRSIEDHELESLDTVSYDPKIQQVLRYINEHLADIRSKRLLFARDLLRTETSIQEISRASGFRDYSTFSRAFRTLFHCSPKEWRAEHVPQSAAFSSRSSSF